MMICDNCVHYVYDEEEDIYLCNAEFDEDDVFAFSLSQKEECRFYSSYDEYKIVRKQN
ncbi:MAG: hypothetical protein IJJ61_04415 [Clostridia bacterium]|nr:hypothetical protein [Clostridia bacterium]